MLKLPDLVRTLFSLRGSETCAPQVVELAELLKIPPGQLPHVRLGRTYRYRPFMIAKKDGRERRILAPSPQLKELQRRLLRRYLVHLPVHPASTAFMPGASIVDNARRHAGQAVIATVDLANFFESTSARRVRAFFARQGWRGEALSALMRLCVYRNGLPQGAPTSPCLSNLVNVELDAALDALARRSGATYTRYGDDLTFSWPLPQVPAYVRAAVHRELLQAGYRVQPRKRWQVKRAGEHPHVTGLELGRDGRIRPSVQVRAKVRTLRWRSWLRPRDAGLQAQRRGYEGFLDMLDP